MVSSDEQFCLKWNDYQHCIKSTFQSLRDDSEFMDVTLSCDGEQIKAHKVILSSCSVTFKNLLKQNPSSHPVFVLWDIEPRDLSAILDFMYNGEVNVQQVHLTSFLSVAERLRVRGLCQDELLNADDRHSKSSKDSPPTSYHNNHKQHQQQPSSVKSSKSSSRSTSGSDATGNASSASDCSGSGISAPPSKRAKLMNSSVLPGGAGGTGTPGAPGGGGHNNSRSVITRTENANNDDDIEEIPLDLEHELDHHNSTPTSATTRTIRRPASFEDSAAAAVLATAAALAAGVVPPNTAGLTVKDLAALSYNAAAAVGGNGGNSGGSAGADDEYGDYYEDEAGFSGPGGVDPVDQSQVGKERGCEICGKQYKNRYSLNNHRSLKHPEFVKKRIKNFL
jgi:hypothetical protein